MPSDDEVWLDAEAGPVVRPYAVTQGRVAPSGDEFDLVAFVVAVAPDTVLRDGPRPGLQPEHHAIVAAAAQPISIVELASGLDLSIGVIRVLLLVHRRCYLRSRPLRPWVSFSQPSPARS